MNISEIGGEFELINRVTGLVKDSKLILGVGDDCAVFKHDKRQYMLVTTDMLVENDHFCRKWSTPKQIGMKAIEVNVSDIAAMGGLPKFVFVSLCLTKDTTVEFVDELYEGMNSSCKNYGCYIVGGDTTHGENIVINITIIGFVDKKKMMLRSGAKIGDLICVTGDLGKSTAGLRLLLKGKNEDKSLLAEHLEPKARLRDGRIISDYANSMIDVSDGLYSEVKHIAEQSKKGAEIYREKISISENTKKSAAIVGEDAYDYALYGGEDFELVFTISEGKLPFLNKKLTTPLTIVGKINSGRSVVLLDKEKNGKEIKAKKGFDHFA